MRLSLSQDLLLLAIHPANGAVARRHEVGFALAGAALADLAMSERITVSAKTVVVLEDRPTGDRAADLVLTRAAASRPRSCPHWVGRLAGRMVRTTADSLVDGEIITTERRRVLGLFPRTGLRVVRPDCRDEIVARLRAAVSGAAVPSDRTRVLVGLAHAAGLLGPLLPGWSRSQLKAAVRILDEGDWATSAVRRAIAEAQAAAATAAVTATAAAVAGS